MGEALIAVLAEKGRGSHDESRLTGLALVKLEGDSGGDQEKLLTEKELATAGDTA